MSAERRDRDVGSSLHCVVPATSRAHQRGARNAGCLSTTRSTSSSVSTDPLGSESPVRNSRSDVPVGVRRPAGEDGLQVHGLPQWACLDVRLRQVQSKVLDAPPCGRPSTSTEVSQKLS